MLKYFNNPNNFIDFMVEKIIRFIKISLRFDKFSNKQLIFIFF
jgi:hypothetical protein